MMLMVSDVHPVGLLGNRVVQHWLTMAARRDGGGTKGVRRRQPPRNLMDGALMSRRCWCVRRKPMGRKTQIVAPF